MFIKGKQRSLRTFFSVKQEGKLPVCIIFQGLPHICYKSSLQLLYVQRMFSCSNSAQRATLADADIFRDSFMIQHMIVLSAS